MVHSSSSIIHIEWLIEQHNSKKSTRKRLTLFIWKYVNREETQADCKSKWHCTMLANTATSCQFGKNMFKEPNMHNHQNRNRETWVCLRTSLIPTILQCVTSFHPSTSQDLKHPKQTKSLLSAVFSVKQVVCLPPSWKQSKGYMESEVWLPNHNFSTNYMVWRTQNGFKLYVKDSVICTTQLSSKGVVEVSLSKDDTSISAECIAKLLSREWCL